MNTYVKLDRGDKMNNRALDEIQEKLNVLQLQVTHRPMTKEQIVEEIGKIKILVGNERVRKSNRNDKESS